MSRNGTLEFYITDYGMTTASIDHFDTYIRVKVITKNLDDFDIMIIILVIATLHLELI